MRRLIHTSLLITIAFIFLHFPAHAQTEHYSDMREETLRQQALSAYPVAQWDSLRCAWYGDCTNNNAVTGMLRSNACQLAKRMFGWHAIGTSSSSYVWQSLSDLSYFSYQVDYLTGNAVNASQLVTGAAMLP